MKPTDISMSAIDAKRRDELPVRASGPDGRVGAGTGDGGGEATKGTVPVATNGRSLEREPTAPSWYSL